MMGKTWEPYLEKDEKLLWTGQPDPSHHFSWSDIFFIPAASFWVGTFFVYEWITLREALAGNISRWLFYGGAPFVAIGIYLFIGRYIFKYYRKKSIYYAVTDRRFLVLYDGRGHKIQSANLDAISIIDETHNYSDVLSLTFGKHKTYVTPMFENTGLDLIPMISPVPSFWDIKDGEKVKELVQQLINNLSKNDKDIPAIV
jgi:hypothetical protein